MRKDFSKVSAEHVKYIKRYGMDDLSNKDDKTGGEKEDEL